MLRTAIALSALTGKAVGIHDIRANRPKPGLAAQHLCAVKGVAMICDALVEGAEIGSTQIAFTPGKVRPGKYRMDVGTAGSVTLVLQACLLASARCSGEMKLDIAGGTNVRWSPPIDFYELLLFPKIAALGFQAQIVDLQRGFYPKGAEEWESASRHLRRLPLSLLTKGASCRECKAFASRRICLSMFAKG